MFLESAKEAGWIEVICGSMFSGKTEELIRRLKRAKFANQRVEIFKPGIDVRYSADEVVSHDANAIQSTPVEHSGNILLLSSDVDVVGIDETQFFDDGIVEVCQYLANRGVRVICAGLDMDYKGEPFGPMPRLWLWLSMLQRCTPSVWSAAIWRITPTGLRVVQTWCSWERRIPTGLSAATALTRL